MFRLVPIGLLYIVNREIHFPHSSLGPVGSQNLTTFGELHALLRREHRICFRQWRELVIARLRSDFVGGGSPHGFERVFRESYWKAPPLTL